MNANDIDKKPRIKRRHFLKKSVYIIIFCAAIALSVLFFRFIYESWVRRHIRNVNKKYSIQLQKRLIHVEENNDFSKPVLGNQDG